MHSLCSVIYFFKCNFYESLAQTKNSFWKIYFSIYQTHMLFQDVEGFQRHPRCLQVCDFFLLLKWTSVNVFFLVSNSTKTPRKGFYVQLPRFDVVALRVRLHPIEFHSIWKWRAGEICFSTETTFPHITFTFQLRSKLDIQQFHVLETVRRIPFEHFFAPFFFQYVCSSIQFVICHFRTKRSLNWFVS